jgi:hypothetical protein
LIDIVGGRSCAGNGHPGNLAFREWLQACRSNYDSACSAGHYGDMVKIRLQALQQIQDGVGLFEGEVVDFPMCRLGNSID